jgi:peptide/nickel transport system substrate-binding protein
VTNGDVFEERPEEDAPAGGVTRRGSLKWGAAAIAGAAVVGGGVVLASGGGDDSNEAASDAPAAKPKRGGVLKVAMASGAATDSLDPHYTIDNFIDSSRFLNLYDQLVALDRRGRPELALAEEFSANAGNDVWTIRIRDGIEFHNGKVMDADDVVFSIKRSSHPTAATISTWPYLDRKRIEKVDNRTVRLHTTKPVAILDALVAELHSSCIVPVDYDGKNPVGTGPFKYKSFAAGEQSTFDRNDNYWGEPALVDELQILAIADASARVDALLSGQVHAVDSLPASQVRAVNRGDHKVLRTPSGEVLPIVMRTDTPPWDDERVRLAMKLIVNREEMVQQVLAGYGRPANDVYSPYDPCYAEGIPQREQDIEQARQLLADAGQSNLEVELVTSPLRAGTVEMAQVFARQAREAGVTINVKNIDINAWFQGYTTWPFTIMYLAQGPANFMMLTRATHLPTSNYNDTKFADPDFVRLSDQVLASPDQAERCTHLGEMQQILHDKGGWIIWGNDDFLDGHTKKLAGFQRDIMFPLGGYRFKDVGFV